MAEPELTAARLAISVGDLGRAVELCGRRLAIDPRDIRAMRLLALARLRLGHFALATKLLRHAEQLAAVPTEWRLALAEALAGAGESAAAEAAYREVLASEADSVQALVGLARVLLARHATDEARPLAARAHALAPALAAGAVALARCRAAADPADREAERLLRGALAATPTHPAAFLELARLQALRGAPAAALATIRAGLQRAPAAASLLAWLADDFERRGDAAQALQHLQRAAAGDLADVDAWALASRLLAAGEFASAEAPVRAAIMRHPSGDAYAALYEILWQSGRRAEAVEALENALRLCPERADLHTVAGAIALARNSDRCEHHFARALELEPRRRTALVLLARWRIRQRRREAARDLLLAAVEAEPTHHATMIEAFGAMLEVADWRRWHEFADRVATGAWDPPSGDGDPGQLGPYLATCDDPARQRAATDAKAAQFDPRPASNSRRSSAAAPVRIRIGYLSSDFREHPLTTVVGGVLRAHDRASFEVIGISLGPEDASGARTRIARDCDRFVDLARSSDEEAARWIAAGVDVLVDLSGHTTFSRPGVLAQRAAPVQAAWLGHPGTLGRGLVDYLVADDYVVPPGAEHHFAERIVRLPGTFFPHDPARSIATPRSRADYGLPEDGIVLCSFSAVYKLNPPVFGRWLDVLDSVPAAVLWLSEADAAVSARLRAVAAARGSDPSRLVFAPRVPAPTEHLARYRVADLALDTFPYGSHTTASDALWAGCPIVTRSGRSFASRVAGSLLHALGLEELVAESDDGYAVILRELATDEARRGALRARLATARSVSRAFDAAAFTRSLEASYRRILERALEGSPPEHLTILAEDR